MLTCVCGQCAILDAKMRHNITFHADASGFVTSVEFKFPKTFTGCSKVASKRTLASVFKTEAVLKLASEVEGYL